MALRNLFYKANTYNEVIRATKSETLQQRHEKIKKFSVFFFTSLSIGIPTFIFNSKYKKEKKNILYE